MQTHEPDGPVVTSEDWRWWRELEEFIGPTVTVRRDQKVTTEPTANPGRVTR
jgi:hypothetical protein